MTFDMDAIQKFVFLEKNGDSLSAQDLMDLKVWTWYDRFKGRSQVIVLIRRHSEHEFEYEPLGSFWTLPGRPLPPLIPAATGGVMVEIRPTRRYEEFHETVHMMVATRSAVEIEAVVTLPTASIHDWPESTLHTDLKVPQLWMLRIEADKITEVLWGLLDIRIKPDPNDMAVTGKFLLGGHTQDLLHRVSSFRVTDGRRARRITQRKPWKQIAVIIKRMVEHQGVNLETGSEGWLVSPYMLIEFNSSKRCADVGTSLV